ncbi:MAG: 30S ribosomal protein S15 [Parcubacteria group bacterium]|nr:30S ribosomal protein S15 [Parcubacteria group bacterium]
MIPKKEKEGVLEEVRIHEKDTGSPEAQIGLLTAEIGRLLLHLKKHKKDMHSKRGLLRMVARRRRLLSYLKEESMKRYSAISKKLGLKQTKE